MTFSHCWDWYWGDVTTGPSIRFDGDNGVHQPGLGLDVWSGPHTSFPPTRTRVFPENGRPGVQNGASETVDLKVALPPIAPLCRVSSTCSPVSALLGRTVLEGPETPPELPQV